MRHDMNVRQALLRCCTLLLALLLSGGCSQQRTVVSRYLGLGVSQKSLLASARSSLADGNDSAARNYLEKALEERPDEGTADEVLFRLSLLTLGDDDDKAPERSLTLLNRLSKEYPDSAWTAQSSALSTYLRRAVRHQAQTRTLRRDNKELRQSLEKLKNLDLDLELKKKR